MKHLRVSQRLTQARVPIPTTHLEKGEVASVFHVSDLQVAHDDLATGVHFLEAFVLLFSGARHTQAVLRAQADHW